MTPDKVEEIVEEFDEIIHTYHSTRMGPNEREDFRTTLTQYHQDLMSEVVENAATVCGCLNKFPGKKFIGGCGGPVKLMETYACVDCSAPFHRKCLLKHLKHEMIEESLTNMPLEEAFKKIDSPQTIIKSK